MTTGLEEAPGEMAASIAGWFRALADETRIRLMMQLKHHGEMSVGALGAALGLRVALHPPNFARGGDEAPLIFERFAGFDAGLQGGFIAWAIVRMNGIE